MAVVVAGRKGNGNACPECRRSGLLSLVTSHQQHSQYRVTLGLAGTYWGEIVAHPSLLWRIWIEDPDQLTISPYHFLFSRITECYHTQPSARSEDKSQHTQMAAAARWSAEIFRIISHGSVETELGRGDTPHMCRGEGAITTHPSLSFVTSVQQQTQTSCSAAVLQTAAASPPRPQCLDILFELLQLPSEVKIHGSPLWWFSWFIVINEMLKGWLTFYLIWATVSLLQLHHHLKIVKYIATIIYIYGLPLPYP